MGDTLDFQCQCEKKKQIRIANFRYTQFDLENEIASESLHYIDNWRLELELLRWTNKTTNLFLNEKTAAFLRDCKVFMCRCFLLGLSVRFYGEREKGIDRLKFSYTNGFNAVHIFEFRWSAAFQNSQRYCVFTGLAHGAWQSFNSQHIGLVGVVGGAAESTLVSMGFLFAISRRYSCGFSCSAYNRSVK